MTNGEQEGTGSIRKGTAEQDEKRRYVRLRQCFLT